MATAIQSAASPGDYLMLADASWPIYVRLLAERGQRRYRITYDRGRLERMTLSFEHENVGELIGRFFVILSEELNRPITSAGSTTLKREDLERGLEPDKCFYIHHALQVQGQSDIDLERDPPPDLAVEIDISRSSLNRMGIYAAIKVPEVWRYDGQVLKVYHRRPNGEYEQVNQSLAFPFLDLDKFADFLRQRTVTDESTLGRAFRAWVRAEVVPKSANVSHDPSPSPNPPAT